MKPSLRLIPSSPTALSKCLEASEACEREAQNPNHPPYIRSQWRQLSVAIASAAAGIEADLTKETGQ